MQRLLYTCVLGILIATGLAHGLLTDRWGNPPDPQAQTAAYARIPMVIGDWDGTSMEMDENQLSQVQAGSDLLRRYVNRVDGSAVTVYLSGGRPGPVVTDHSPESCYTGSGYHFVAPPAQHSV